MQVWQQPCTDLFHMLANKQQMHVSIGAPPTGINSALTPTSLASCITNCRQVRWILVKNLNIFAGVEAHSPTHLVSIMDIQSCISL